MTRKREIIVQKQEDGEIISNWLANRYTYHDLEKWTEYINNGRVKINGESITPDAQIRKDDVIAYYPEPIIEPPIDPNYITLYEDDDLLVINKPSDLPSHPGGIYFENTLWYILKQKYGYISLINRLDRETSGVMLIAKNKISAKFYFNKMMEREIDKEYLVLVHGVVNETIEGRGWLIPAEHSRIRKKRDFIPDSSATMPLGEGDPNRQYSYTEFSLEQQFNNIAMLRCKLHTGRTHQIRATLNSMGYPVVGDKIYGVDESFFFKFINDELTLEEWGKLILKNQALHSVVTTTPMLDGTAKTFLASKPASWDKITLH